MIVIFILEETKIILWSSNWSTIQSNCKIKRPGLCFQLFCFTVLDGFASGGFSLCLEVKERGWGSQRCLSIPFVFCGYISIYHFYFLWDLAASSIVCVSLFSYFFFSFPLSVHSTSNLFFPLTSPFSLQTYSPEFNPLPKHVLCGVYMLINLYLSIKSSI